MPSALILVTGVPGVGKTTNLRAVTSRCEIVQFGTRLVAEANRLGYSVNRDALRLLPPNTLENLRNRVVASIPDRIILDMHLSIRTVDGFRAAIPDALLHAGSIRALIVLEADPAVILERRTARPGRQDDPGDREVHAHQAFNRKMVDQVRTATGCEVRYIEPDVRTLQRALEDFGC